MARAHTQCDQCGQVDDHPKVHLGVGTKHHDCLSVAEKAAGYNSGQAAGSGPKFSAVVEACEGGAKGDELLALILDPEALPQAEGFHEAAQRAREAE